MRTFFFLSSSSLTSRQAAVDAMRDAGFPVLHHPSEPNYFHTRATVGDVCNVVGTGGVVDIVEAYNRLAIASARWDGTLTPRPDAREFYNEEQAA